MSTYAIDPVTGLPKRQGGNTGSASAALQGYTTLGPLNQGDAGSLNLPQTSTSQTPGGTLTIPGYTPDYASLIANDPTYLQLQKDLAANGVSDMASRNAAINRALIGFGQVPDLNAAGQQLGISGLSGVVDPTTAALASENKFSTAANLTDAHTKAIRAIQQGLAARGGLRSGELGYQLGQENQAYGQANNDATQKLLDYIAGTQSAYTTAEQQRQMQLDAAAQQAAATQATLHPPTGSQTAYYDSATGLYLDPSGHYWNPDGTPASPPSGGGSGGAPSAPSGGGAPASVVYFNPPAADYAGNTGNLDAARQRAGRGVYF